MANKLAEARRSLHKAKEAAHRRLEEIETERKELKASLKSLDAAIRALGDTTKQTQAAKDNGDSSADGFVNHDVVSE